MFDISAKNEDGLLTIFLGGRVDSSNAAGVEAKINEAADGFSGGIVVDIEKLEYISSAGLRVLLRLKKANPSTSVVNASSEVYEIFDMTGFTEMMDISKAYRRISVEGCEVIGEGANGLVYRIDADTIVKVYKNRDALEDIKNERELARKAFVMGVPTAIPYDVVKVGDLYGSVFELLDAKSFAKLMAQDVENTDRYAKESVDILKIIHSTELKKGELPDKKKEALVWARFCLDYLPDDIGKKLVDMVSDIPDADNMLHGDYHIKNIMRQKGENLLIDMDTLAMGHRVFEFSAIFLAYKGFSCVNREQVREFLGISPDQADEFFASTLKYYFESDDEKTLREIEDKSAIIGYARLLRRTVRKVGADTQDGAAMIDYCKKTLIDLVSKYDDLVF